MIRALLAALLALVATIAPAAAQDAGRFVTIAAAPSVNIVAPRVTIWLPPGYDAGRQRYGVVYMHDGQNLFDRKRSSYDKVWAADRSVLRLVAAHRIAPVIIVGIDQPGEARYRQYFPKRLYAMASPGLQADIDSSAKGPLTGDAYLRFLTDELKPLIDRSYRTRTDAAHTAVIGSSMGGLISCYAFVERPQVFGRAGCVSTHWPLTFGLKLLPGDERPALWKAYLTQHLSKPAGRRLWMDHGDQTLDASYPPFQALIDADLVALGWRKGRDFESRAYPGAAHEENAWAARMDDILGWLLR
ncbi:alpha/beta hydrolase [Sphingomonas sp. PAMC 26605]|uniref:alpha/beta hydrolase n=1 Tax=Sphingomonas sp. PAMC 26605 TaxID=1112214 RepID=UPI00026CAC47|nr:alpha/beta hydrolase-fold protein [Sphingomonas sp. PAMC 26605]